jgi:hypothetical protein
LPDQTAVSCWSIPMLPEYTALSGTRVIRSEDYTVEQLKKDLNSRYTLRLRGGMPSCDRPSDNQTDVRLVVAVVPEQKYSVVTYHTRQQVAQSVRANPPTTTQGAPTPAAIRLVYEYWKVDGEEAEHVKQSICDLNEHPAIQSKCTDLEKAGHKFLKPTSVHRTSLAARRTIPPGTELRYYIRAVYYIKNDLSPSRLACKNRRRRSNRICQGSLLPRIPDTLLSFHWNSTEQCVHSHC